jgi:hypothetical protein
VDWQIVDSATIASVALIKREIRGACKKNKEILQAILHLDANRFASLE